MLFFTVVFLKPTVFVALGAGCKVMNEHSMQNSMASNPSSAWQRVSFITSETHSVFVGSISSQIRWNWTPTVRFLEWMPGLLRKLGFARSG